MGATTRADSVVKKIFATDRRIQFCAVVDANGRIETGGMRPGIRSLEPTEVTARIVTRLFLSQAMQQAGDEYLGEASWAIVRREKLIHITFPLQEGKQLQITTTVGYPLSKVEKLGSFVKQLVARK